MVVKTNGVPELQSDKHHFETLQIHAGRITDIFNSCATPIYETASFAFNDSEHGARLLELSEFGNIYTRITNPTVAVFANRIAALEGGVVACATASGTSAVLITMLSLTSKGDNFVSASTVHGGTYHTYKKLAPQLGLEGRFVSTNNAEDFAIQIDSKTKFLFVESISNPKYDVPDFAMLARIAHDNGIPLVVDNTFGCAGFVCRPIEHGADIIVHSATKWIGGHGTTLGGVIVDAGTFDWGQHRDRFPQFHANSETEGSGEISLWHTFGRRAFGIRAQFEVLRDIGSCLSAMSAHQLMLGLETLGLRCERHSYNTAALACWLAEQPQVTWVSYLGNPEHPSHERARRYLRHGFGSLLSFGIRGGKKAGFRLCDRLKIITSTANLGDAKTLIVNPWCTTHQQLTDKDRNAAGVSEDHMRLSVGIEHIDDLKADLKQAFERIEEEVVNEEQESDRYELQKKMICALYGVPPNRIEATV